ncbi:MAG: ATP-binding cassette domain-containing protein [Halobacteriovoraceae bacterium]|nr:ATP-binding cassette domain-containing protein [Halobacteriovoraceae bacterium]
MFDFHKHTPNTKHFTDNAIFSAESLHVTFGNIQALRGVDFKIQRGEIVFLTGVSGAGKTTLLKVLCGIHKATKGKVKRNRNLFVSPIFQDLKLLPKKTIRQNLELAYDASVYKDKKEFESDLMDFAKYLGVDNRLNIKVQDANGGLKQKVAFMRALLAKPDVILADEPTAALDYDNAKRMFDILNILNVRQGLTVVWATHNRELVKKFTGRMVHIDKGRLIYSGHACFI